MVEYFPTCEDANCPPDVPCVQANYDEFFCNFPNTTTKRGGNIVPPAPGANFLSQIADIILGGLRTIKETFIPTPVPPPPPPPAVVAEEEEDDEDKKKDDDDDDDDDDKKEKKTRLEPHVRQTRREADKILSRMESDDEEEDEDLPPEQEPVSLPPIPVTPTQEINAFIRNHKMVIVIAVVFVFMLLIILVGMRK